MNLSITPAAPPVSSAMTTLLESSNDSMLDLAAVADEKLFMDGRAGAATTLVARLDGQPAGVVTICGSHIRILAVDRRFRRRGVGSALLDEALRHAEGAGRSRIVIGAEPGNYFLPGIEAGDHGTIAFFEQHGFERTSGAVNLICDTAAETPDRDRLLIRLASPADRDAVVDFVLAEFGQGWIFEVERSLTVSPSGLFLAYREGQLSGFAGFDVVNRGLGTFGPAGVAQRERGTGTGRTLLLASLEELRKRGFERCIIQWAAALPFYAKTAGAVVLSEYQILSRTIGADSDRVRNR